MGAPIERKKLVFTGTIHSTLANCTVIDMNDYSGLSFLVPSGVTQVTYYASAASDGSFGVVDNIGTAGAETVTADNWHVVPAEVFSLPFVKIRVTTGTGGSTSIAVKQ